VRPRNVVIEGDAAAVLRRLASESVDACIGSPPYFRLRRYTESPAELGTEETIAEYVAGLRMVCREMHRVLKPTGSLWIVIGDSYSRHERFGAGPKSLLAAPERVILALLADGWILRAKVAWTKTTPLPSPIKDRLTNSWEYVLHFVKQPRYHFDLDPIRIRLKSRRSAHTPASRHGIELGDLAGPRGGLAKLAASGRTGHPAGRNPTDHWHLPPGRSVQGHTATYPEVVIRRPILATVPERICTLCGLPWLRATTPVVTERGVPQLRPLVPCRCQAPTVPGLVLDPWVGTGATLKVARELGRDGVGVELSGKFAALARERAGFDQALAEAA
jgi:site-specific DNA-methyltransferase (adenine-specific)